VLLQEQTIRSKHERASLPAKIAAMTTAEEAGDLVSARFLEDLIEETLASGVDPVDTRVASTVRAFRQHQADRIEPAILKMLEIAATQLAEAEQHLQQLRTVSIAAREVGGLRPVDEPKTETSTPEPEPTAA